MLIIYVNNANYVNNIDANCINKLYYKVIN